MNRSGIGSASQQTIEGIDFANEMPLAQTADSGLQLIAPTVAESKVTRAVRTPVRAAAAAASHPACPPPITMISKLFIA